MKNKKGQDLSIGTLILIVLGIVVLVLLILGFTMGWENLWEKINIFGGTSSVGDVVTACRLAQTSQDKYTLCQRTWDIEANGQEKRIGCRDDDVTSSLGTSASEFGCENSNDYQLQIARCVPKESECTGKEQGECIGPCKFTRADSDSNTPEKCTLADNARTTCAAIKGEDDCNNKVGCEYS